MSDLSDAMARAVESAGASVVGVTSGCGRASGFALDADTVLTSASAVEPGKVALWRDGGERVEGEVIGRDAATDVALVRASLGAAPLALRDAAELRVGHLALALGRPGLSVRASLRILGVVADDVGLPGGGRLERYVETDRALPQGFAGGPLIDLEGNAIGMNTRALMRRADLAITAATIRRIAAVLREHGGVVHGYLGVSVYPARVPEAAADESGARRGALVIAVDDHAPAQAAGILVGDLIVALAGKPVTGPRALREALYEQAEQEVEVSVVRGGRVEAVAVVLGKRSAG
jgi:S1-C subfamily serine protease